MTTNEINKNQVVLQLLGIDKKWIRTPKGEWVDKKTLKKELKNSSKEMETEPKKWWMFWRSINRL